MKRKIVQHGPSTLIISLPSQWVKQNNIKKGDELDVKEDGATLSIGVEASRSNYSMTQDVSKLKPYLVKQFLARAYQKGYDSIYITHNSVELLKTIKEKTLELIGYELVEQNDRFCVIQSISSHIELDFDNSLRRGFLLVKLMLEDCMQAYNDSDESILKNLSIKDLEVKRFCFFCMRQITKSQYVAGPEIVQQSHILYTLIGILEELGSNIKTLSEHLVQTKKKTSEVLSLLRMLHEQYGKSYAYFYKADAEKANGEYKIYTDIENKVRELVETKLNGLEIITMFKIKDLSHMIHQFTTMRLDFLKEHETSKQLI
ncbi:MAG TPA: phosphate uptake regulator PhoU [Candidatus Nanoarchaeia archaeon]|nr:phosphate uptake regulator PhoU [Candidatus Nanoarchaeia archaeon]